MALTNAQQNVISEFQQLSFDLIKAKYRMLSLVQMYSNENIASVTTDDLLLYPEFAHMTAAELQDAGAALAATNTTLGDFSTGTNVAKLMKIVVSVPK